MLTGLKVPSWASKCVFDRPEHNAEEGPQELYFEGLEIQK